MKSLQSHEGVLLVDHRASPGLSVPEAVQQGLPASAAGSRIFECATFTCSHCERVVAVVDRRKADEICGFCTGCNHRLCTKCTTKRAKDGVCLPVKVLAEQLQNVAAKQPATEVFVPKLILP